jgi:hypothetical protein
MAEQKDALTTFQDRVSAAALTAARQVLAWAEQNGMPPQDVGPAPGGGVRLEWRGGSKELRLVIHPDGVAEYLLHGQTPRTFEAAQDLLRTAFAPGSRL